MLLALHAPVDFAPNVLLVPGLPIPAALHLSLDQCRDLVQSLVRVTRGFGGRAQFGGHDTNLLGNGRQVRADAGISFKRVIETCQGLFQRTP